MKNILITGKNSYIGMAVEQYLRDFDDCYHVEVLDMKNETWRVHSFAGFDCVFHVAGIAHVPAGKLTEAQKKMYYSVNCDLALETAQKARKEGVRQFIFMSSAIVYGNSGAVGEAKMIERDTPPAPVNAYGDSKLRAERGLGRMQTEDFAVAVVRPPMIYGPGCKGNYPLLAKAARVLPCFPKVNNARSMLYVGHLAAFIRYLADTGAHGIFWPQNAEYVNTSEMVREIAAAHGRKIWLVPGLGELLKLCAKRVNVLNKVFGNLTYDQSLSQIGENYRLLSFRETIMQTENKT